MWGWIIPIFVTGLSIGSFINVLIDRWPQNKSPFKGRSVCDHCGKTLGVWDLIPVFSYISLGGRCRYCHKKLSWQYPIIEIFTGFMFLGLFYYVFSSPDLGLNTDLPMVSKLYYLSLLLVFSALLVIFVSDMKYQVIPDEALVILFFGSLIIWFTKDLSAIQIVNHLLAGFVAAGFLGSVHLLTKGRGMGMGDVKYGLLMGIFLGTVGTLVAMYLAFLTGGVVSMILIISKRKKLSAKIAFGPFLVIGTVLAFFKGATWLNGFLNLLSF